MHIFRHLSIQYLNQCRPGYMTTQDVLAPTSKTSLSSKKGVRCISYIIYGHCYENVVPEFARSTEYYALLKHDDVIKWKHFLRYWPSVRGVHRSPVNSPQRGQWRGALMFTLISAWINAWVNNRKAGYLRRHHTHYDGIVMISRHLLRSHWSFSWFYLAGKNIFVFANGQRKCE